MGGALTVGVPARVLALRCAFSGNAAMTQGGAVFTAGYYLSQHTIYTNNSAHHGGGLFVYAGTAYSSGDTYTLNSASSVRRVPPPFATLSSNFLCAHSLCAA